MAAHTTTLRGIVFYVAVAAVVVWALYGLVTVVLIGPRDAVTEPKQRISDVAVQPSNDNVVVLTPAPIGGDADQIMTRSTSTGGAFFQHWHREDPPVTDFHRVAPAVLRNFSSETLVDSPSSPAAAVAVERACAALMQYHVRLHGEVLSAIDFRHPPLYKMPWYFHDPNPLCGRHLLHHLAGGPLYLHALSVRRPEFIEGAAVVRATAGVPNSDIELHQCGECSKSFELNGGVRHAGGVCGEDVLITARLVGPAGYVAAEIVDGRGEVVPMSVGAALEDKRGDDDARRFIRFTAFESGEYRLDVKLVHVNGSSANPTLPRTLGVIGIRAAENNRKSFKYNALCDTQRHVYGSPIPVIVTKGEQGPAGRDVPFCTAANHTRGRWVHYHSPKMCASNVNPYCWGDPTWLSDASAYNTNMLWAPLTCKYRFFTPPMGPSASCMRSRKRAVLLLIGDSVTREYGTNCQLFNLRDANLVCVFNNIALEGQHYSLDYANAVARELIKNIKLQNAGVFATNLGIHHMIGAATTAQWREFVGVFARVWSSEVLWSPYARNDSSVPKKRIDWSVSLEKAVWLGPPTIQYARKGMGYQRAAQWDHIAWSILEPLGFVRLYAIAPTSPRQEGTWDGLHYNSQRGKVQSLLRNRQAKIYPWNGGVANMLFTMMLNLVCNDV